MLLRKQRPGETRCMGRGMCYHSVVLRMQCARCDGTLAQVQPQYLGAVRNLSDRPLFLLLLPQGGLRAPQGRGPQRELHRRRPDPVLSYGLNMGPCSVGRSGVVR